jgi:hypothetical protein
MSTYPVHGPWFSSRLKSNYYVVRTRAKAPNSPGLTPGQSTARVPPSIEIHERESEARIRAGLTDSFRDLTAFPLLEPVSFQSAM